MTTQRNRPCARILITDDDSLIREVLLDLLSDAYECQAVASAEEALERLRAEPFQLVLSDITMPGL